MKKKLRKKPVLNHAVTIPVPAYDPNFPGYTKPMEWCDKNCRGAWQFNLNGEFLFEYESDMAFFSLTWRR